MAGEQVRVYTDGSCSPNPGIGGWAWTTTDGRCNSGGAYDTTNNRMELVAVIEAIESLDGDLVVVSDSWYVVGAFQPGLFGAKQPTRMAWMREHGFKKVPNADLWRHLAVVMDRDDKRTVTFEHVRGHQGDRYNEIADRMAVLARLLVLDR